LKRKGITADNVEWFANAIETRSFKMNRWTLDYLVKVVCGVRSTTDVEDVCTSLYPSIFSDCKYPRHSSSGWVGRRDIGWEYRGSNMFKS
jgi:hypothetical protein